MADGETTIEDGLAGPHTLNLKEWSGDFVLRTRPDGLPSYHLAVVADDIAMGVTHVIRGRDLLPSAHRHVAIYRALGATPPRYFHVPLVRDEGGRRLAKRDGDTRIAHLRDQGVPSERLVGWLAWTLGLSTTVAEGSAESFVDWFDLAKVPRQDYVVTARDRRLLGLESRPAE